MKIKNFDNILTECLKEKGLRYIRFKVDPSLNDGFKDSNSYEGFVLQEFTTESHCGIPDMLKVLIPTGPMSGILDIIKPVITPNKPKAIEIFKKFIANKLNTKLDNKTLEQIKRTDNIDDIEQYLKQSGMTDNDILELYKNLLRKPLK